MKMRFSPSFLAAFLVVLFGSVFSAPTDSLVSIWNNEDLHDSIRVHSFIHDNEQLLFSTPEIVFNNSAKILEIVKKRQWKLKEAKIYNSRAIALHIIGKKDSSENEFLKSLKIKVELKDSVGMASAFNNLGILSYYDKNYIKSIDYYLKSLELYEQLNRMPQLADVKDHLGLIFFDIEDFETAEKYQEEAIEIYESLNNQNGIDKVSGNLALSYVKQKHFTKAYRLLRRSIQSYLLSENIELASKSCLNLSSAFLHDGHLDSAEIYVRKGIQLISKYPESQGLADGYEILGKILLDRSADSCILLNQMAIKLRGDSLQRLKTNALAYKNLYKAYKKKKWHEKSLKMLEKYMQASDSLNSDAQRKTLLRKVIEHEFEKKQQVIRFESERALLEQEQEHIEEQMKSRKTKYLIIIGGLLVFIVFYILFLVYKHKNKTRQKQLLVELEALKTENEKNRSASDNNALGLNTMLDFEKINKAVDNKLNESDLKIISVLYEFPDYSNLQIGEKVFLSSDGVNSSLKKMYRLFDIVGNNKRISLLMEIVKISRGSMSV